MMEVPSGTRGGRPGSPEGSGKGNGRLRYDFGGAEAWLGHSIPEEIRGRQGSFRVRAIRETKKQTYASLFL